FFFHAEDAIRVQNVTGVQTCVFRSVEAPACPPPPLIPASPPPQPRRAERPPARRADERPRPLTHNVARVAQQTRNVFLPRSSLEIGRASCRESAYLAAGRECWREG